MSYDAAPTLTGTWPPEVPPFRPPGPPTEPAHPAAPPRPPSILPSWEERDERPLERDVAERLLEHRIVVVGGRLDESVADHVAAQLLLLGRSTEPVELHLACPEAGLGPALSVADAVDLVDAPVHAIARGTVAGPAVAVLCASLRRTAHRNALFVLSVPPPSGARPQLVEQHRRQAAQLHARVAAVTGRTEDEVAGDFSSGRLLDADEALAYGLVEELR